jgi:hypothetical protein
MLSTLYHACTYVGDICTVSDPELPNIMVYIERPWNGICWYILWSFGVFCDHLVYFVVIWYFM